MHANKLINRMGAAALGIILSLSVTFSAFAAETAELVLNSEDNSIEMEARGMYGRFYIPSLDINVALFDGTTANSEDLQTLVDNEDSAAWFTQPQGTTYIAEHRNQSNMENIKNVVVGETLSYIQQGTEVTEYVCVAAGIGTNCTTYIADENGESMDYKSYGGYDAAFITYTCTRTEGKVYYAIWTVNGEEEETIIPETGTDTLAAEMGVSFTEEVLALINEIRAENGLSELVWGEDLETGTAIRTYESSVYFSHTRPDGTDWYTADEVYLYGEILAKGYTSAEGAVAGWMASDGHRALILKDGYRTACCAYTVGSDGKMYWAVEFGY